MASDRLLIIDGDESLRRSLREKLVVGGLAVTQAGSVAEARRWLSLEPPDVVLLDTRLPDGSALDLLREIVQTRPEMPVLITTASSTLDQAVEAMKLGAADCLAKPVDPGGLLGRVGQALERSKLRREARAGRELAPRPGATEIIGESAPVRRVLELVHRVAKSETSTVLVTGESGTGKDLVAKAIHDASDRARAPFLNITCTAIAETLLESELFGHEKGAFTDARTLKHGLLELANGGTAFLDEIGDMPLSLQAKLLRFLQEKRFRRVGGTTDIEVDVRVIGATNRDLRKLVAEGRFREDLFYRLNVIPIEIPPLRERPEDIPLLCAAFIREFNANLHKEVQGIATEAEVALRAHAWPGNVRELRNVLERATILGSGSRIELHDLPPEVLNGGGPRHGDGTSGAAGHVRPEPVRPILLLPPEGLSLQRLERELIVQALQRAHGNRSRAARLLGLKRDQVRYRILKFRLRPSEYLTAEDGARLPRDEASEDAPADVHGNGRNGTNGAHAADREHAPCAASDEVGAHDCVDGAEPRAFEARAAATNDVRDLRSSSISHAG